MIARSKPDPLSDDFSEEYFHRLYGEQDGKLSVKAFLATKQRIPGLGNGVLQDILFHARAASQTQDEHPDERGLSAALSRGDADAAGDDSQRRSGYGARSVRMQRRIPDDSVRQDQRSALPCLRREDPAGGLSGRQCVLLPQLPATGIEQLENMDSRNQCRRHRFRLYWFK